VSDPARASVALSPVAPFEFELSLRFADGFGPASGEQVVDGGRLWKAFRVDGRTVADYLSVDDDIGPRSDARSERLPPGDRPAIRAPQPMLDSPD
jgi:hypothetical protein